MRFFAGNLDVALAYEVAYVYETRFPARVDPQHFPALTELAEAVFDASNPTEAVEALLRRCFPMMVPKLEPHFRRSRVGNRDLVEGLEELFGLTTDPDQGLEARRDRGGPHLGYPNGKEGVRKAYRMVGGNEVKLEKLLRNALTDQLIAVAAARDFHYKAKYAVPLLASSALGDEYGNLPVYLALLESMNVRSASTDVHDLVAYIEAQAGLLERRVRMSPVAMSVLADFPGLPDGAVKVLSEASAHFFAELLNLYETSFNPHSFGNLEALAFARHPAGGLPDWYGCVPYIPDEEYFLQDGDIDQDEVDQTEWLLLWIAYHCKGSPEYRHGVAELLGLLPPSRGVPRLLREDYASKNLGFESGTQLCASGLPLGIIYEFTYALTRITAEIELHSYIEPKPHWFQVQSRPMPGQAHPLTREANSVTVTFSL